VSAYIDAHHHLWSLAEHPQTWMDPATDGPILRDFTETDLATAAEASGVTSTVVVQSVNDAAETGHLLARAAATPLIAGVVGWVDLTSPDVVDQIAAWREGVGGRHLVGFRHLVQDEPDPAWLDRPAVRAGLATLAAAGLTFDLLVKTPQLPAAIRTVHALPENRFVLDHLAKPPLAGGSLAAWSGQVRELAGAANVSAKISGLVTEADWHAWTLPDLAPAVDVALEAFGTDRLMVGSDWPVCLLAASYARVVETAELLLAGLSPPEHSRLFADNARDFYRL
jgi:L-fuconolactonase